MRPNRFFTDLDTSASIQWLTKESLNDCSEDYILQRIKKCDGREEMRVYSYESSCSHSMDLLRSLYLRGDSIESLRPVYLQTRERLRLLWNPRQPVLNTPKAVKQVACVPQKGVASR